jgi:hypothetical protein
MRVWRALKSSGAATLRDGAYLLPWMEQSEAVFREQAAEIEAAGGTAYVAGYTPMDGDPTSLFDRTAEYAELFDRLESFKQAVATISENEARRALAALRRDFGALEATDFFPGPSQAHLGQVLADAETALNARFSPDEPHAAAGALRRHNRQDYRRKTWTTRAHIWIDRVASAWLIRRFIDPQARFVWLKDIARRPANVIGFDFDGAEFTHVGTRVTFEVLAFSFGLEKDPAIARLGTMVHYLDVGGVPVPEAAGFAAIMAGARANAADDDALLAEIGKMLDYLYAAYSEAKE